MHGVSRGGDIAVVGLGCRFPRAPNVSALWRLVRDGEIVFEEIATQRWNHASFYSPDRRAADKTYAVKGAFIDGIDEFAALHFGIAPRRLQVTDPQHRLLIETVREALQDAGYDARPFDRANTGVFVGASVSEYKDLLTSRLRAQSIADGSYGEVLSSAEADALKSAVADVASVRTFSIAGSLLNMMAAAVSQVFDLSGPSFTLDAACSSALVAIHEAVVHLRAEQCNVALAGGVYLNLTPDNLVGFSRLEAISPSGNCRPFDARADGFVMGEGVGVVVLKRLADACRDGDRIYAVIRGTGCNNDGRGEGPMTPRSEGQVDAMDRAYRDAGNVAVETIEFVETHGTATTVGDVVEFRALRSFFEARASHVQAEPHCYLGSIKANIGHTMAAAGVAGFIKAVLAVQHGVVPPQPSVETPNPELGLDRSPFRLTPVALPWPRSSAHPRRAAVSSFGFGGTNVHIVLEQMPASAEVSSERDELFLISAPTGALLSRHLIELAAAIEDSSIPSAAVAYTLATRTVFERRVAFVAKGASQLLVKLRTAAAAAATGGVAAPWSAAPEHGGDSLVSFGKLFVEGATVEATALMQEPDHVLATLPPSPLERQRYWAVEPSERPFRVAPERLTRDHTTADVTPATRTEPEMPNPIGLGLRRRVERYVLAAVAHISAFPLESVRENHQLTAELGFDSLMLVDLAEDISKEWPQAGMLSYETLPEHTSIRDVIDFVLEQLGKGGERVVTGSAEAPEGLAENYSVASHAAEKRTAIPISRFNHVYLDSHVIGGQRVLPFAAAMDYMAEAALDAIGQERSRPFTIAAFHAARPVVVLDTSWLDLSTTAASSPDRDAEAEVTLSQDGAVCYRGTVRTARQRPDVIAPVPPSALPLPLREFYDRITFHGPHFRGIASIEGIAAAGISGTVNVSVPREWIKQPDHEAWSIDPLVIDCGFQLAAYWIWVKHGCSAFPVRFDEYTQLAPFAVGPVRCTARLEALDGERFRGSLSWSGPSGELLAVMRGVTAEARAHISRLTSRSSIGAAGRESPALAATESRLTATHRIEQFPEFLELKARLQLADTLGVANPYFRIPQAAGENALWPSANKEINFSSYNYVNNSGDPVVSAAAIAAIEKYGTSVSASRVASGERPLHSELERELAAFLGTESCLVFTSGHATNVTVIGHIVGAEDLILHDELAHDSIIQGAKLSGAKRRSFPHGDADALDRTLASLRKHYRRVLICIEGAYSMDGDIPDLPRFIEVKKCHQAMLFVDEAHSIGVIGRTGRGIAEYYDVARSDVDMWMGTLSKSFASCGGFIGGSHALIEYLKYTTPGFVYSVGITPPNAAAALAALRQVIDHPERVQRLQRQAARFVELLKSKGIDTGRSKDTAVVPAIIGDSVLCLRLADALNRRGINVQPILYPAVAEAAARLRFFICCEHTDDELETTADILVEEIERILPADTRLGRSVRVP